MQGGRSETAREKELLQSYTALFIHLFSRIKWLLLGKLISLFNFLLILCDFHILYPNPTHPPVPLYPPSALATSP